MISNVDAVSLAYMLCALMLQRALFMCVQLWAWILFRCSTRLWLWGFVNSTQGAICSVFPLRIENNICFGEFLVKLWILRRGLKNHLIWAPSAPEQSECIASGTGNYKKTNTKGQEVFQDARRLFKQKFELTISKPNLQLNLFFFFPTKTKHVDGFNFHIRW